MPFLIIYKDIVHILVSIKHSCAREYLQTASMDYQNPLLTSDGVVIANYTRVTDSNSIWCMGDCLRVGARVCESVPQFESLVRRLPTDLKSIVGLRTYYYSVNKIHNVLASCDTLYVSSCFFCNAPPVHGRWLGYPTRQPGMLLTHQVN